MKQRNNKEQSDTIWYTDDNIKNLLDHYITADSVFISEAVTNIDLLLDTLNILTEAIFSPQLIIPLHVNVETRGFSTQNNPGNHWVGLHVKQDNSSITVNYVDPKGRSINQDILKKITEHLKEYSEFVDDCFQVKETLKNCPLQVKNDNDCGPMLVYSLVCLSREENIIANVKSKEDSYKLGQYLRSSFNNHDSFSNIIKKQKNDSNSLEDSLLSDQQKIVSKVDNISDYNSSTLFDIGINQSDSSENEDFKTAEREQGLLKQQDFIQYKVENHLYTEIKKLKVDVTDHNITSECKIKFGDFVLAKNHSQNTNNSTTDSGNCNDDLLKLINQLEQAIKNEPTDYKKVIEIRKKIEAPSGQDPSLLDKLINSIDEYVESNSNKNKSNSPILQNTDLTYLLVQNIILLVKYINNLPGLEELLATQNISNEEYNGIQQNILVIGKTQTGKSTSINYLLDRKLKVKKDTDTDKVNFTTEGYDKEITIGTGFNSQTCNILPWIDQAKKNIYWDTPGAEDNRTKISRMIQKYRFEKLFKSGAFKKNFKILFTVKDNQITDFDASGGFSKFVTLLENYFGDNNFNEEVAKSTAILITQGEYTVNSDTIESSLNLEDILKLMYNGITPGYYTEKLKTRLKSCNSSDSQRNILQTIVKDSTLCVFPVPKKIHLDENDILNDIIKNKIKEQIEKVTSIDGVQFFQIQIDSDTYKSLSDLQGAISTYGGDLSKEIVNLCKNKVKHDLQVATSYEALVKKLEKYKKLLDDIQGLENDQNTAKKFSGILNELCSEFLLEQNLTLTSIIDTINCKIFLKKSIDNKVDIIDSNIKNPFVNLKKKLSKFDPEQGRVIKDENTLIIECPISSSSLILEKFEDENYKGLQYIKVYSYIFLLDKDIELPGVNLTILAHQWNLSKDIIINLSGKEGKNVFKKKASIGMIGERGEDGKAGGDFFGFAEKLNQIGGEYSLTINTSGGLGQDGQDGGDGLNGKHGLLSTDAFEGKLKRSEYTLKEATDKLSEYNKIIDRFKDYYKKYGNYGKSEMVTFSLKDKKDIFKPDFDYTKLKLDLDNNVNNDFDGIIQNITRDIELFSRKSVDINREYSSCINKEQKEAKNSELSEIKDNLKILSFFKNKIMLSAECVRTEEPNTNIPEDIINTLKNKLDYDKINNTYETAKSCYELDKLTLQSIKPYLSEFNKKLLIYKDAKRNLDILNDNFDKKVEDILASSESSYFKEESKLLNLLIGFSFKLMNYYRSTLQLDGLKQEYFSLVLEGLAAQDCREEKLIANQFLSRKEVDVFNIDDCRREKHDRLTEKYKKGLQNKKEHFEKLSEEVINIKNTIDSKLLEIDHTNDDAKKPNLYRELNSIITEHNETFWDKITKIFRKQEYDYSNTHSQVLVKNCARVFLDLLEENNIVYKKQITKLTKLIDKYETVISGLAEIKKDIIELQKSSNELKKGAMENKDQFYSLLSERYKEIAGDKLSILNNLGNTYQEVISLYKKIVQEGYKVNRSFTDLSKNAKSLLKQEALLQYRKSYDFKDKDGGDKTIHILKQITLFNNQYIEKYAIKGIDGTDGTDAGAGGYAGNNGKNGLITLYTLLDGFNIEDCCKNKTLAKDGQDGKPGIGGMGSYQLEGNYLHEYCFTMFRDIKKVTEDSHDFAGETLGHVALKATMQGGLQLGSHLALNGLAAGITVGALASNPIGWGIGAGISAIQLIASPISEKLSSKWIQGPFGWQKEKITKDGEIKRDEARPNDINQTAPVYYEDELLIHEKYLKEFYKESFDILDPDTYVIGCVYLYDIDNLTDCFNVTL